MEESKEGRKKGRKEGRKKGRKEGGTEGGRGRGEGRKGKNGNEKCMKMYENELISPTYFHTNDKSKST